MSRYDPHSWLDRAVGACFRLLLAAAALYVAVRLIEAVWPVLVVICLVAGLTIAGVSLVRGRRNLW